MNTTATSNDITQRVRARVMPGIPRALIPRAESNIALCFDGGYERLVRSLIGTPDQVFIQKEISATPVLGVVDMSVAAFDRCLIHTINRQTGIRTSAGAVTPVKFVNEYNQLLAKLPKDTVWAFMLNRSIILKNPTDGLLTTYVAALKISTVYIPTLDDQTNYPLHDEIVDQFVDRLSEIVQKLGGLNFLKADDQEAAAMIAAAAS